MRATRLHVLMTSTVLMLAAAAPLPAQQENDGIETMTEQVEKFFANLADPTYSPADVFTEFVARGPLEPQQGEMKKLIEQFNLLETNYGELLEVENIGAKTVGKDLVIFRFLYKMERFPVVWYFTYYRPPASDGASWKLVSLKFDTRLHLLAM